MANPFPALLAVTIGCLWSGVLAHAALPTDNTQVDGGRACTTKQPPAPTLGSPLPTQLDPAPPPINLAQVLDQWKRATAHVVRVDCRVRKFKYDIVFEVEYRSEGTLALDCDGRARQVFDPLIIEHQAVSHRRNEHGKPFALKSDQTEHWLWTDESTIRVHPTQKLFERVSRDRRRPNSIERPKPPELPEHSSSEQPETAAPCANGKRWCELLWEFFIPRGFLIGSEIGALERDFEIELTKETASRVWLTFRPRNPNWSSQFSECVLILNRADWSPYAVKMVDPSQNSETVFVFSNLRFNRTDAAAPDLANPDLIGYRPLK